jgi:xylulose-5-phosphate/fructose-6-phosphate phosphoketolase
MGANPHANGGLLLHDLKMPDFRAYAVEVPKPGTVVGEATKVLGGFLRDVMKLNLDRRNFRVFGPDETASNRLGALFDITQTAWMAEPAPATFPRSRPWRPPTCFDVTSRTSKCGSSISSIS